MAKKKASSLEISDIRVKYDKNDGSLRITSKDPDLKGKPFSLTITGDSPTAKTLFELMREHRLVEDDNLPTELTLKGQEELEALYDPDNPLQFVLGETYGGELTKIDLSNLPHMLVSGASGSGKSVLLKGIAKQIGLRDNFRLSVFDPTGVQWVQEELRPQDRILRSNEALAAELEQLEDELQYRHYRMSTESVNHAALIKNAPPYKVLMIDYASHFLSDLGIDKNDGVAVAKHELAKNRLSHLLRVGRSAGIYVIFSTQNFDFETLPADVLSVVPIRVAMGSNGYMTSAALLGKKPLYGRGVLNRHGRGVLSVGGEQTLFQAYYVPVDLA
jgi:DNA segregation ATPase FtsK/SpoIIIE-like protein